MTPASRNEQMEAASWIWCDTPPHEPNQYALFRRELELPAGLGPVSISLCADSRYWLYANGTRVGFGPGRYSVEEPLYDTHDLTPYLHAGANVIAVRVYGMGQVYRCSSFMPVRCGLVAVVTTGNTVLTTDAAWKTRHDPAYTNGTPRYSNHQGHVECYDTRAALPHWAEPDFDDSAWQPATLLGKTSTLPPWERLRPRDIPLLTLEPRLPVRIVESGVLLLPAGEAPPPLATQAELLAHAPRLPDEAATRHLTPTATLPLELESPAQDQLAYALFDFGSVSAGYLSLRLRGEDGSVVDLGYLESTHAGKWDLHKEGIRYGDRVVVGPESAEFHTTFPKTLRYLLVAVSGKAVVEALRHEVSTYPMQWRGGFWSADPVLDTAWHIGAHTVQICAEDIYMDTPRRERAGWLGDLRIEALAAAHAFGDTRLARHSLGLFFQSQDRPGRDTDYGPEHPGWVSARYPSIDAYRMPDFNASLALPVRDYLLHSGDTGWVRALWPRLLRVTEHLESYRHAGGLVEWGDLGKPGAGYILVDWAPFARPPASAPLNLLYAGHLGAAVEIARHLGLRADAEALAARRKSLVAAIRTELWDARRGVFVNAPGSPRAGYHENLLALLYDVALPEQATSICQQLLAGRQTLPTWLPEKGYELWKALREGHTPPWDDSEWVPVGSPYFTFFALEALFETGHARLALDTVRTQYGRCLAAGATSTWEQWDGSTSHSHGWGAAPTIQLPRYVLGVAPLEPGYTRFEALPTPGGLAHAGARIPTPHGIILAEYEATTGRAHLRLRVPPGTEALAGLPGATGLLELEGCPAPQTQTHTLRRGPYQTLRLGPGDYRLSAPLCDLS